MIGVLVVSHGRLAEGLADAVKMIIGEQEAFDALALLPGEDTAAFSARLEEKTRALDQGAGVLIFADLMGATPFNESARIAHARPGCDVITGANLPLLLETLLGRAECASVADLVAIARGVDDYGVKIFSEVFAAAG